MFIAAQAPREALSYTGITTIVAGAAARAGIPGPVHAHQLRHSAATSSEDGIPEILVEQRLGHDVPGMRGLYAHVSPRMREDLIAALQPRWENSLRERASIDPRSPVLLLDNPLAPFRPARRRRSPKFLPERQQLPSSA